MIAKVVKDYPFQVVATTLRKAKTATRNDWGAICYSDGTFYQAKERKDLEIYDRVGGGDSFASGLIYGFLADKGPQWAVECGAAHGALAMTTPGDTSMVTLPEVIRVMELGGHRHTLVANLPAGVFFIGGSRGRPIVVNARARHLLGQREDASAGLEHMSAVYRLHRPDGTLFPVEELPVYLALRRG